MRVLFVDDHELTWHGMRVVVDSLLEQADADAKLVWFCARNLEDALAVDTEALDLILLDYHLQRGDDGLDAMRALHERFDAAPTVIVSGDDRPDVIRRCVDAGAAGYVIKTMAPADMVEALRAVVSHRVYLPLSALQAEFAVARPVDNEDQELLGNDALMTLMRELSPRQGQVFLLALRGKPNKLIARELGIAEGTVKVHLAMVFRVLGVHNRTEALYRVLSAGALKALPHA